jgi:hypothetical protein
MHAMHAKGREAVGGGESRRLPGQPGRGYACIMCPAHAMAAHLAVPGGAVPWGTSTAPLQSPADTRLDTRTLPSTAADRAPPPRGDQVDRGASHIPAATRGLARRARVPLRDDASRGRWRAAADGHILAAPLAQPPLRLEPAHARGECNVGAVHVHVRSRVAPPPPDTRCRCRRLSPSRAHTQPQQTNDAHTHCASTPTPTPNPTPNPAGRRGHTQGSNSNHHSEHKLTNERTLERPASVPTCTHTQTHPTDDEQRTPAPPHQTDVRAPGYAGRRAELKMGMASKYQHKVGVNLSLISSRKV